MQVRVLFVQYNNPSVYPPIEHAARTMTRAGLRVRLLGLRSDGQTAKIVLPEGTGDLRFARSTRPGPIRFIRYCVWVTAVALKWRPTWVYVSDVRACLPGLLASTLTGCSIAYHEHDAPDGMGRLLAVARERLIARAGVVIVPSRARAAFLPSTAGDLPTSVNGRSNNSRIVTVPNFPALEDLVSLFQPLPAVDWFLHYHGSIVPEHLPLTVLEALRLLPDSVRLQIVGYETAGHRGYPALFMLKACQAGLKDRVSFLGAMTRAQTLQAAETAQIGLALSLSADPNLSTLAGASVKVFEYLARGLVPIVPDTSEWRTEFSGQGLALMCDPTSARSIADAVRRILDDPQQLRDVRILARKRLGQDWNYESAYGPVLERLQVPVRRDR